MINVHVVLAENGKSVVDEISDTPCGVTDCVFGDYHVAF